MKGAGTGGGRVRVDVPARASSCVRVDVTPEQAAPRPGPARSDVTDRGTPREPAGSARAAACALRAVPREPASRAPRSPPRSPRLAAGSPCRATSVPEMQWRDSRRIQVQGIDQQPIELEINAKATAQDLQCEVGARLNLPACRQLLSFKTTQFMGHKASERCLGEFDLPRGCTVNLTDFSSLLEDSTFCPIEKPEHRGITLVQLCRVLDFVKTFTRKQHWVDIGRNFGQTLVFEQVNLYQARDWVIKPSTTHLSCSFVEVIAHEEHLQKPSWYVSHWWGECIQRFTNALVGHATLRGLPMCTPYWVCAYAINQHDIEKSVSCALEDTAFMRAMRLCVGTVLVLDTEATPFKRVWCCFEEALSVSARDGERWMLLDIATIVDQAQGQEKPVIITDGLTPPEVAIETREKFMSYGAGWRRKADREKDFPMELIKTGLEVNIMKAEASYGPDRNRILNYIAGRAVEELDNDPPSHHDAYDGVNCKLCAIFALAGWPSVCSSAVIDRDECWKVQVRFGEALSHDVERTEVNLSFFGCASFGDEALANLARSLPPNLEVFTLNLGLCQSLTVEGVLILFAKLPSSLRSLSIDFHWCHRLDDAGMVRLAGERFPPKLECLRLSFMRCPMISDAGFLVLLRSLPSGLLKLDLNYDSCSVTDASFQDWGDGFPPGLECLALSFACCSVHNVSIAYLTRHLPERLTHLNLNFDGCPDLDGEAITHLVQRLPLYLEECNLDFRDCSVRPALLGRAQSDLHELRRWQRQLLKKNNHYADVSSLNSDEAMAVREQLVCRLTDASSTARCLAAMALCNCMGAGGAARRACNVSTSLDRCGEALTECYLSDTESIKVAILEGVHQNDLWARLRLPASKIIPHLENRGDREMVLVALAGLCSLPDEEVASNVDAIGPFLDSEECAVRHAAIACLGKAGAALAPFASRLVDMLDANHYGTRAVAGAALVQAPPEVLRPYLSALPKLLGHPDPSVRTKVEVALRSLSDTAKAAAYADAMSHADWETRRAATEALAYLGREYAQPHLQAVMRMLGDPEPRVWVAAVETLHYLGIRDVHLSAQDLAERAWSEHKEVYERACQDLVLNYFPDDTLLLGRALAVTLAHPAREISAKGFWRLQQLPANARAEAMLEAFEHKNKAVRKAVADAMPQLIADATPQLKAHVAAALFKRLRDADDEVLASLSEVFLDFGIVALGPLADGLQDPRHGTRCRVRAAQLLCLICFQTLADDDGSPKYVAGSDAMGGGSRVVAARPSSKFKASVPQDVVQALVYCLSDSDVNLQAEVSRVLCYLGQADHVQIFRDMLQAGSAEACIAAASALKVSKSGAFNHADDLALRLKEENSDILCEAAAALANAGDAAIPHLPEIAALLSDADEDVQDTAVDALVRLGSASAEHVAESLQSDNWRTRARAIEALGRLGNAAVPHVPALVACLEDQRDCVRTAAREVLAHLSGHGSDSLGALLSEGADLSGFADAGTHMREVITPRACALGEGANRSAVRAAALIALGLSSEAVGRQASAISGCLTDVSMSVRRLVLQALKRIENGVPDTRKHLLAHSLLEGVPKDLRIEAMRACGRGVPESCEGAARSNSLLASALGDCLSDGDREVRDAAAKHLVQLGAGPVLPDVLSAALHQLQSQHYIARQLAAEVIRDIAAFGADGAAAVALHLGALEAALNDSEKEVRLAAVNALAHLGPFAKPCVRTLRERFTDVSGDVREAACLAMEALQERRCAATGGGRETMANLGDRSEKLVGRSQRTGNVSLRTAAR